MGARKSCPNSSWPWVCLALAVLSFLGLVSNSEARQTAQTDSERIDFVRDIQPIFSAHCVRCHGHDKQEGDYRLDVKAEALAAASSGEPPIIASHADQSQLLELISGDEPEMPAEGDPLSKDQVAKIRQWIDEGAHWPDAHAGESQRSNTLWSIQPLQKITLPSTSDSAATLNPIDAFVRSKLDEHQLQISPPADSRTLVRRLFLDVWGMPPTPEQIESFTNDRSSDAYGRLVQQTLDSPHYGERWARHWLDIVRFAESNGFETNVERSTAYHFRDWVIDALNRDLPFDQFAAAQIAGDQMGHDRATGFLVAGAWDEVKSPDINLTLMQREDELADMVGTTSTTFLGLTLACARCHQHKFDPLEQSDYYSFKAILAGVQHGTRKINSVEDQELTSQLAAANARRNQIRGESLKLEPLANVDADLPKGRINRSPVNARENVDHFSPVLAKFVRFVVHQTNQFEPCLDELEIWGSTSDAESLKMVGLAGDGARATSSGDYPDRSKHKLEQINDGRYGNDFSWISSEVGKGWVQIELPQPSRIECVVWGRDRQAVYADRLPIRYEIQVAVDAEHWQTVATETDRLNQGEPAEASGEKSSDISSAADDKRLEMLSELKSIDARIAELQNRLNLSGTAYVGKFTTPPEIHRLYRGEPQSPREIVGPDVPKILGSLGLPASADDAQRRVALAKWFGSDAKALVARVIVNRIWQHHFGHGIVNTPSDFGTRGSPPSHPELLDWLAQELIDHRWSMKHIHQLILMSDTYRQADLPNPTSAQVDADARWLWRFPPRRLEAEAIRDSILAVTGSLDLTMGGPGFSTFEPNTNYVRVYNPKMTFEPSDFRRMIYMTRIRMRPDQTFGAFDSPDGGLTCPVRTRSTTPLQAFHLLNSPFVIQQADIFAKRLRDDVGENVTVQVERAFLLALGRKPSQREVSDATSLIEKFGLSSFCRAMLNSNEFLILP